MRNYSSTQQLLIISCYKQGMSMEYAGSMAGLSKTVANRILALKNIVRLPVNEFSINRQRTSQQELWMTMLPERKAVRAELSKKAGLSRSVAKLKLNCLACGEIVYRYPNWLKYKFDGPFCNRSCSNIWRARTRPEWARQQALKASQANKMQDTKIELLLQTELRKRNIEFKTNWLVGVCALADIFIDPNIVIFADGVYWHDYPNGLPKDHRINEKLRSQGFKVFRFWEHDIHTSPTACINAILEEI